MTQPISGSTAAQHIAPVRTATADHSIPVESSGLIRKSDSAAISSQGLALLKAEQAAGDT